MLYGKCNEKSRKVNYHKYKRCIMKFNLKMFLKESVVDLDKVQELQPVVIRL
jgi:hypothetical protein